MQVAFPRLIFAFANGLKFAVFSGRVELRSDGIITPSFEEFACVYRGKTRNMCFYFELETRIKQRVKTLPCHPRQIKGYREGFGFAFEEIIRSNDLKISSQKEIWHLDLASG